MNIECWGCCGLEVRVLTHGSAEPGEAVRAPVLLGAGRKGIQSKPRATFFNMSKNCQEKEEFQKSVSSDCLFIVAK